MGGVSKDLNKCYSVYSHTEFEAKHVIEECLIPFPHLYVASVNRALIHGTCLLMLDVA